MMRTDNVARWLEAAERQVAKPIEAIAIGAGGAVTRSEGLAALDHDFSNDFGETVTDQFSDRRAIALHVETYNREMRALCGRINSGRAKIETELPRLSARSIAASRR